MTRGGRRLALITLLAAGAASSWWFTRYYAAPVAVTDSTPRREPDYIIENFRATDMDSTGKPKHRLSAAKLVHYSDDGSRELDQPYLIQYTPGQAPMHVRADKGYMPKLGDRIRFSGDVRMARGRDPRGAGGEIRTQTLTVQLDRSSS